MFLRRIWYSLWIKLKAVAEKTGLKQFVVKNAGEQYRKHLAADGAELHESGGYAGDVRRSVAAAQ